MTETTQPTPPPLAPATAACPPSRRATALACIALLLAVFAAYANSFSGPFIYDDQPSIVENPTLRHWWRIGELLSPPRGGATVSGRPALNLSFALNYAISGTDVRGYHAANILIHALAALALLGLVRRTLLLPELRDRFAPAALPVALAVAALWALHPLQTEAVTYLAQRAESLMVLFYLVTLYCFLRSTQSPTPRRWQVLAFASCLLGMATKENMVSAPILVLLLDRALIAGSFAAAWRSRARFYLALAATWILLGALVASTGGTRDSSAGFGVGVVWWDYALTQFPALATYLKLSFWPRPLVFDYGTFFIHDLAVVWPQACLVAALVGVTLFALWRRPVLGFLGGLFFAILAPTSLMPGTTQMIVEHRMYLPLAPLAVLVVVAIFRTGGRRSLLLPLVVAAGLGCLTFQRNADYRSELAIWQDTVAKRPDSVTAQTALGSALAKVGRTAEAIVVDQTALRLQPHFALALGNLGNALNESGRPAEALPVLEEALRLKPHYSLIHINLGVTLDLLKQPEAALAHYETAVQLKPSDPSAQNDFGDSLSRAGKLEDGITHLQEALRLKPDYVEAQYNLAAALARAGRMTEAQALFDAAFRHKPSDADALASWGNVLLATGHAPEAIAPYEAALRLKPAIPETHYSYATILAAVGRNADAIREYDRALSLRPDFPEAHNNLGNTLLTLHRDTEAIPHYMESLRLKPFNPAAQNNLGLALARTGRLSEAAGHFQEAVRQAPNYEDARNNLARARAELPASAPGN